MYYFHSYINFKNKYFEELKNLPAPIREMTIFQKIVSEIPLEIRDDDLIPGRYGSTVRPGDPPPEKTFSFFEAYSDEEKRVKNELFKSFGIKTVFDAGHTCIDYGYIINHGIKAYEEKVRSELKKDGLSYEKRTMLSAMMLSVECVKIYMNRFAILAAEKYSETGDNRFLKMQDAISAVPYNKADTFYKAIVSIWTMHSLSPIADGNWSSISLGRIDQYLYPLYKKEIENGTPKEELMSYLENLFRLLNCYGDGACALNVGGMDKDGNDMTNELSYLLLEVEKKLCYASPIFTVRLTPGTPEDFIDSCIDSKLFRIGQPTFYGEANCRKAVVLRGVPENDAVNFSVNSCMGLYMSGEEIASMWGIIMNMHLPLELTLNNGKPLCGELPFTLDTEHCRVTSLEELLILYKKYLQKICTAIMKFNRKNAYNRAANRPNAFLSMMTANCIESGKDRAIGAKYNTETVEAFACANTADAICAIDTLVFREKKYTIEEYINAVKNDFESFGDILADIKKCPKYGTNNEYADYVMRSLCGMLSEICKAESYDNVYFIPSLHTLDGNVHFGEELYTTFDGRLRGKAVAKNAGPVNEVRDSDPTSLIISASSTGQELFSGGQPIDLYFGKSLLDTKEKRDRIKALIKTYIKLGGLQLQVNSVDIELLEKAMLNPDEYRNVVVRIGGYSRRFTELSKEAQLEFIQRFRLESKAVPQ